MSLIPFFTKNDFYKKYKVEEIKDLSGYGVYRARILFENKYQLSIIEGDGCYANENEFEIAVFNPKNEMLTFYESQDEVLGYQSVEQVLEWIRRVSEFSNEHTIQFLPRGDVKVLQSSN